MSDRPRVTVGLPTFNRAAGLERAARSVLGQSYRHLELVISDNASTDETPERCAQLADDPRVVVRRRDRNVGLTANFNGLLEQAGGELVMIVADDDWLDPEYLERCVATLDARPDHVLVSGSARYHRDGEARGPGIDVACPEADPAARVRSYFTQVVDNASIYGVMRRAALETALPMPNALAGDWMLIGRLLMHGKLDTIADTHVHRSVGGTSATLSGTARAMGLTSSEERHPHLAMARLVYRDIASDAAAYAPLGASVRRRLGLACAGAILRTRPLGVLDDELGPLLRRPRLRRLDAAARRVAARRSGDRAYLP